MSRLAGPGAPRAAGPPIDRINADFGADMLLLEGERSRLKQEMRAAQDAGDEARGLLVGLLEGDAGAIDPGSRLARSLGARLDEQLALVARAGADALDGIREGISDVDRRIAERGRAHQAALEAAREREGGSHAR